MAEPKYGGCCRLAKILGISRHSSNRFLLREEYKPQDLFEEIKKNLNLKGGVLSAVEGGDNDRLENLEIDEEGKIVTLKEFGSVKVFKKTFKDGSCRYYATFRLNESELKKWTRCDFRKLQTIHWGIECYHRALKQLCGLSKFQVRKTEAIVTHVFCSLRAFCQLELMRIKETVDSWYELQRELYLKVAREFILEQLSQKVILTT